MSSKQLDNALALIRAGGRAAEGGAGQLYDHFWPRFRRHFLLNGQNEAEAEELADQALVNIVRGVVQLENDSAFSAWAWRVANNVLVSHVRQTGERKSHEVALDDEGWDTLLDIMPVGSEFDPVTWRCLGQQAERFEAEHPDRLACLNLALIEGLDMPDIALALGRSYQAASTYLHECRKRLWLYLGQCFGE